MEIENIRKEIKEKLEDAERVLVGVGAEWKKKDDEREEIVGEAAEKLRELIKEKDYFVISTLPPAEAERLGFDEARMVIPFDEALTEEAWNRYTDWLSRTLNRKLVILELGEGFMQPTVIRWPFEKTAAINQKAYLYRIHKTFYQISDEIREKATAVKADSAIFFAEWPQKEQSDRT